MTGYTHIAAGISLSYIVGASGPETIACLIASIIPDIDNRQSMVGRLVPWPLKWIISHKGFHRRFLHTIPGAIVMGALFSIIRVDFKFFILGYLVHLFLDSLNKSGVSTGIPGLKRVHLASIKLGSWGEKLIFAVICALPFFVGR